MEAYGAFAVKHSRLDPHGACEARYDASVHREPTNFPNFVLDAAVDAPNTPRWAVATRTLAGTERGATKP